MTGAGIDIPGYEGRAVRIDEDCIFRVIDVEGCQIADMFTLSAPISVNISAPR